MSRLVIQALALMGIYLLVMTSAKPADAVVGLLLGLALAVALRPRHPDRRPNGSPLALLVAAGALLVQTAAEMARGSWRTARFCLRGGDRSGFVEIPRAGRSRRAVALWGVVTGEAPDEVPVDVDEERDVLIVHLVDASDPVAVRWRHQHAYEDVQRKVVA
jgi:multisubunit Na+/H+ antiporter MnhE subunit